MFTGIVARTLRVINSFEGAGFKRLILEADPEPAKLGESIAINGVCLTVAEMTPGEWHFDVIPETLKKSNLGELLPNDRVNMERSLRVGDRIDGHFVQGHVDGVAELKAIDRTHDEWRLVIHPPAHLMRYIAPKGSVSLDGVSLTVAALRRDEFEVALIPTTLQITTLGEKKAGWPLNLEADMMTKNIVNILEHHELLRTAR